MVLNPFQYLTLAVYGALFLAGLNRDGERFNKAFAWIFLLGMAGFLESLVRTGVLAR